MLDPVPASRALCLPSTSMEVSHAEDVEMLRPLLFRSECRWFGRALGMRDDGPQLDQRRRLPVSLQPGGRHAGGADSEASPARRNRIRTREFGHGRVTYSQRDLDANAPPPADLERKTD